MNKKSELVNTYTKKVKDLKKYSELYFNQDKPKITDAQYDNLKKEIIELEKKIIFSKN